MKIQRLLAVLFLLSGLSFAQLSRVHSDIAFKADGRPAGGATVRVCTASATGVPCSPLASIYSDNGLTTPKANPFTADDSGNYSYYAGSALYKEQVTVSGVTYTHPVQLTDPDVGDLLALKADIVPTPNPGDCASWSTTTSLTSIPCPSGGGGGSGDVSTTPAGNQTIVQPANTSFNPNRLQQVRYATNYQFSQSPGSPSTISAGAVTVTLNGVLGINAYSVSKVKHYLWLAGTGTAERVLITATTCTGVNTGTCTVTFTAANSHSAGYTLGTATGGWQEAWVDGLPITLSNPYPAAKIAGSPTNDHGNVYTFNAPFDIDMPRGVQAPLVFDFQSAIVQCNTSALPCLDIGTGTAGTIGLQPLQTTISNVLFEVGPNLGRTADGTTVAIHDHGQAIRLDNVVFSGDGGTTNYFDDLVKVDDDEAFVANYINTNTGGGPGTKCDSTYCGVAFKGTTLNGGAVGYISNSNLTMQCSGNGVDWQSGNTVKISNAVVQAFSQFGVRGRSTFATNTGVYLDNVYNEVGSCTNPLGTGSAGLIYSGGYARKNGGVGPGGKLPNFTASNTGVTQMSYYVVTKSSTLGTSIAALAGYCLTNLSGTCTVKWNQIGTAGTITYDLIRIQQSLASLSPAPYTANCGGGSVAACGSVATGVTTASCSNNVCTQVDDVTASTSSYTVATANYFPAVNLWPGAVILAPGTDTNSGSNVTFYISDRYTADTTGGGLVSFSGRRAPALIAQQCTLGLAWTSGYLGCATQDASNANAIQGSLIIPWGRIPDVSRKGLTIYENDPNTTSIATDVITLGDSDPALTAATPGNRPASSANDTAIGIDNASAAIASFRLGFRAPVAHRWYVGSIFDNSSWKEELNSTAHLSKLPYDFQNGPLYQISGHEVVAPASPASGFQKGYFKAGTGFCSKDSAGVEYCPGGTGGNVSNSGTPTVGQLAQWVDATHILGTNTLTLPTVTGSTQCLQANSSGVVSGSGVACGSGGGGPGSILSMSSYGSAQLALNALTSGQTLLVDGTYTLCNGTLSTSNVVVTGGGFQSGTLQCATANQPVLTVSGNGVKIEKLNIKHITSSPTAGGDGLVIAGGTTGTRVTDNIIQRNYNGLSLGYTTLGYVDKNYIQNNNNHGVILVPDSTNTQLQWQISGTLSQKNLGNGFDLTLPIAFNTVHITGPTMLGDRAYGNVGYGYNLSGSAATSSGISDTFFGAETFASTNNNSGFHLDNGPGGGRNTHIEGGFSELAGLYTGTAGFADAVQSATNTGHGVEITSACDPTISPSVHGMIFWENSFSGAISACAGTQFSDIQAYKNGLATSANSYERAAVAIRASNISMLGGYFRDSGSNQINGVDISNSADKITVQVNCDSSVATCVQQTTSPTSLLVLVPDALAIPATAITSGTLNSARLPSQYKIWDACNGKGLGDGLNLIPAATYLQFSCVNNTGVTITITGIKCYADAGTSTLNVANNAGTSYLTGAVTCNNTKTGGGAAGTQSATVTIPANDAANFTFVTDGAAHQTNWTVSATY